MNSALFLQSYVLGLSLIIAIGSQNIYIIKLGLQYHKKYTLIAACIAATSDTALITLGTLFMNILTNAIPAVFSYSQWIGSLFLLFYGMSALVNGVRKYPRGWDNVLKSISQSQGKPVASVNKVVITTLLFSLLNPHVYLDTFLVLGNIGSKYNGADKVTFVIGAGLASYSWFMFTGLCANKVSAWLKKEIQVRLFDITIGLITLSLSYSIANMDFTVR
ncbi:LysE family transporter [Vibrio sp. 99-8-1]|uniref:LysE/ArgO family amino acid transporter n=1 Tax=Vibrio sp. 99-8-1 TaxID=2607602 RepID=UPI001493635F|nr:LysE family transporter [Vibrio sp. 99-8-1]NOI66435.1 hypothetical protein [Vibrio sp. 99-8-1]